MRKLTIIISLLLLYFCCISQGYGSYVFENDTLAESGNDLLLTPHSVYTKSLTRCQPNAQACGRVHKFDTDINFMWSLDLTLFNIGNEHSMHLLNDSTIIAVGRKNMSSQAEGFYHYEVSTDGEIIDFVYHPLPYERNINYGSLIKDDILYMYGVSVENVSIPGINVDALISTYNFETGEKINDYFDYNNNFYVDIYDLQQNSDSTLVFMSRRRNFDYISERDYVIEEIQTNGSRQELYNIKVPDESGIENKPSLEVLSDGRIAFFKTDETEFGTSKTIRILSSSGDFLEDIIIWGQIFPDVSNHYNLTGTMDGGFVVSGQYFDRTMSDGTSKMNGMLLKISNQGELEWVRQYKHYHNITGEPIRSFLFDVEELPNGDIVATGTVENTTSDLWVIKTNSEGCLGEDNCGETTVGIEEEIFQKSYINVYPNPVIVGQALQIEVSSQLSGRVDYQLIDMQGRMVQRGQMVSGKNMVSTSGFSSGSYVLNIDLGVRGMESKVVIVK